MVTKVEDFVVKGDLNSHCTFSLTSSTIDLDTRLLESLRPMPLDVSGRLIEILSWNGLLCLLAVLSLLLTSSKLRSAKTGHFPMERICGRLGDSLRSRQRRYSNISRALLRISADEVCSGLASIWPSPANVD